MQGDKKEPDPSGDTDGGALHEAVQPVGQYAREGVWLICDYLPEVTGLVAGRPSADQLGRAFGARKEPVLIPWDCADGFFEAHWRRPEAYLDEHVRRAVSVWTRVGPEAEQRAVNSLRDCLSSGRWAERNRDLIDLDAAEFGLRLLVARTIVRENAAKDPPDSVDGAAATPGLEGPLELEVLAVQVEHGPVGPAHQPHQGNREARYVCLGLHAGAPGRHLARRQQLGLRYPP